MSPHTLKPAFCLIARAEEFESSDLVTHDRHRDNRPPLGAVPENAGKRVEDTRAKTRRHPDGTLYYIPKLRVRLGEAFLERAQQGIVGEIVSPYGNGCGTKEPAPSSHRCGSRVLSLTSPRDKRELCTHSLNLDLETRLKQLVDGNHRHGWRRVGSAALLTTCRNCASRIHRGAGRYDERSYTHHLGKT